jgi:hypothetical protein
MPMSKETSSDTKNKMHGKAKAVKVLSVGNEW